MKNFLPLPLLLLAWSTAAQTSKDTTLVLKEAVVSARVTASERPGSGSLKLSGSAIGSTPALLGEPDIIKTLQLLPGVQAGMEGLSGLYIRGGGPDENLMLLDGVQMYGRGHLLGIFSTFQSEAAQSVTLIKGGFPARYGGRASGILGIRSAEGDMQETHGTLGIGVISDKFHLEGPLAKGKASFAVSGRGMHTLLMEGAFHAFKIPANYYFHDLSARATWRPDRRNKLSFIWFQGKDKLRYEEEEQGRGDVAWGGTLGAVSWEKQWDGGLHSCVTAAATGYMMDFGLKAPGQKREGYGSGIRDLTLDVGFRRSSSSAGKLTYGAGITRHSFIPEEKDTKAVEGWEMSVYLEDNLRLTHWLDLEAGLRLSEFISGKASYFYPEPRISLNAASGSGFSAKASYSRMVQYIHLLSPTFTTLPIDIWVPVTGTVGPLKADQAGLGIGYGGSGGWEVSLEGYLKRMDGAIEYRDGVLFIDGFDTWEEDVACGIGRAAGVELLVRKKVGKTTGWLGYTLSKSERRFPDGSIEGGEWFPSRYDRLHDISAVLNRKAGKKWDLGAVWTYSTGGALRNGYRLPPSHRLDLSARRTVDKRRGQATWTFGVYNAYNRKNPNLVFHVEEDEGPGYLKTVSLLPVIPSASWTRVF